MKMACTEVLLKSIGIENSTTLVIFSRAFNARKEELFEQLQQVANDVLLYTFDTAKEINIYFVIQIIILVTSYVSDVKQFFREWRKSSNFHGDVKYIIYYFGANQTVTNYDQFANAAWELYAYNLAIIDGHENIYVQKELGIDNCNLTTTRILTSCAKLKSATQSYELARFKNIMERKYVNFHRCPISTMALVVPPFVVNVTSPTYRGLEPLYLEILAERMNISLRYIGHNYTGWGQYKDGKFTDGMYKALYRREADLMIGMFWLTVGVPIYFDFSAPIIFTNTRFYMPLARRQIPWMDIARIYTPSTWGIMFGTLFFMALFYCYIEIHQKVMSNVPRANYSVMNEMSQSFMDILATILSEAIRLPTKMLNRIVIMSWILVAFIFSSTYEGVLLSFLMTPVYEKQIVTIQDVVDSGLPIYGSLYTRHFFEFAKDPHSKHIVEHYIPQNLADTMASIQKVATEGNCITASNFGRIQYLMKIERKYLDNHNQSALYIGPPFLNYPTILVMQRGLPIKTKSNEYIRMLTEGGWIEFYQRNVTMTMKKLPKEQTFVPIKNENILLAYFIYLGGMATAVLVFLMERLWASKIGNKVRHI